MEYSEWVPKFIQNLDQKLFGGRIDPLVKEELLESRLDSNYCRAVNLLACDPRAKKVWQSVKKRLSPEEPERQLRRFIAVIETGLKEPSEFWDMTPKSERDKELESAIRSIEKLSKLLKVIDLPPRIFNIYFEAYYSSGGGDDRNIGYQSLDTETHLKELVSHLRNLVGVKSYLTQQPSKNSKLKAEEICFIRRLQQFFIMEFGTPLDETVILLTNMFLEKLDISRDDIRTKRKDGSFPTENENRLREGYVEWQDGIFDHLLTNNEI
jgi:hypothetical protein